MYFFLCLFRLDILFCILIMLEIVIPLFADGPFNPLIAGRRAEICSRTYMANLFFYSNTVGSLEKTVSICNKQISFIIICKMTELSIMIILSFSFSISVLLIHGHSQLNINLFSFSLVWFGFTNDHQNLH